MENVQMLLPIDPAKFWCQLKTIVEEVIEQKNAASSSSSFGQKYSNQPLLKSVKFARSLRSPSLLFMIGWNRAKLNPLRLNHAGIFDGRILKNWSKTVLHFKEQIVQKDFLFFLFSSMFLRSKAHLKDWLKAVFKRCFPDFF